MWLPEKELAGLMIYDLPFHIGHLAMIGVWWADRVRLLSHAVWIGRSKDIIALVASTGHRSDRNRVSIVLWPVPVYVCRKMAVH